jgi:hypothetical protein
MSSATKPAPALLANAASVMKAPMTAVRDAPAPHLCQAVACAIQALQ